MASLEELQALLLRQGSYGGTISWEQVEADWGVTFPSDYKAFLDFYGPGLIGDYLPVSAPSLGAAFDVFGGFVLSIPDSDTLEMLESPYLAHPSVGGLVNIGGTPDGDAIFFRTATNPKGWHVVTWTRAGLGPEDCWTEHGIGLVDFVVSLVRGELSRNPFGGSDLWRAGAVGYRSWLDA